MTKKTVLSTTQVMKEARCAKAVYKTDKKGKRLNYLSRQEQTPRFSVNQ